MCKIICLKYTYSTRSKITRKDLKTLETAYTQFRFIRDK